MKISTITLFPNMFASLDYGVVGRAIKNKQLTLAHWNPRDFTTDKHRTVDDRPYGGGPGMVMMAEPLHDAIRAARSSVSEPSHVINLSPQGIPLTQDIITSFLAHKHLILIAGRYEGIDERLIETEVDAQYSIGDYIVSGGELPAMILLDAITRLLPGVLGHEDSAEQDSFSGSLKHLLDCPHYTRPRTFQDLNVPDILLTGDHQAIARWRLKQSLGRTWLLRPDLLAKRELTSTEKTLLNEFKQEQ